MQHGGLPFLSAYATTPAYHAPMLSNGPPSVATMERFLARQIGADFSYPGQGCSLGHAPPPPGYRHDRANGLIGHGPEAFERARAAVAGWAMFDQPGVMVHPTSAALIAGSHVVVSGSVGPAWVTGACRIVETVDTERQFGFAYGTLSHVVHGEESFVVERRDDDSVWFTINVYSTPQRPYARLLAPYLRARQSRFRREAIARVAVASRRASALS